jgi:hypothetical protein
MSVLDLSEEHPGDAVRSPPFLQARIDASDLRGRVPNRRLVAVRHSYSEHVARATHFP